MATAALRGTYTLSSEGARQLAALSESASPTSGSDFSSQLRTDATDSRARLAALQSLVKARRA